MKSVAEMEYHPTSEKLVRVLCNKTQKSEPLFFRILVAYYLSVVAAHMRCSIATADRGLIPVNMFALNLATSGFGKGLSTNIIEEDVLTEFRERFMNETFPLLAEINLPKLALKRAARKSTDPDEELGRVQREFDDSGSWLFSFCEGTSPAVKQMRHKLLMADAGAVSLEVDEIGLNLVGNTEVLTTYLELYDKGKTKTKATKSSADNKRIEEIRGQTPTNMMLFGTPSKLFDGSTTENQLYSMLETGYARRCFFGYVVGRGAKSNLTAEERYALNTGTADSSYLEELSEKLCNLADMININKKLVISKETSILLIEYQIQCENEADKLPEHEDTRKAEMEHRYFKVLKLAGTYAFIDDVPEITPEHIYNAIKLAEDSGEAFNMMLTRDRAWVKLAKYLASIRCEVTQADLVEDLPFYRGSLAQKAEMLTLAIAHGYKNNIVIKKRFDDGVEFIRGETLKPTDLNKMVISYSTDFTTDYRNEYAAFDQLHKLTQASGMHWVSHHLNGGYRNEENCIAGFNLAVIDVDGGVNLSTAKLLLKNYKYLIYTTKRHTETEHRFRIILPLNYELAMDAKDYKEFMANIYEWLPFEVDTGTNQRSRKWMSHNFHYEYNEGEVLDVLPFIPKTSKNEKRKELLGSQQSMDNLERWFLSHANEGGRNNTLIRFALTLVDVGFGFDSIRNKIMDFNNKLPDKLDEAEIISTVLTTVAKQLAKRA